MEDEVSFLCSQQPATGSYPEPVASSSHPHELHVFIESNYLHVADSFLRS